MTGADPLRTLRRRKRPWSVISTGWWSTRIGCRPGQSVRVSLTSLTKGILVSAAPPPKAKPNDVFQSAWYRLVLLFFATYLTVLWFVLGPSNPWYAVSVVSWTFGLGPAVAGPLLRRVPGQWFRVPAGERLLHRIVGVGIFGWLLDVSGWNRRVAEPMRGFSGKRAGLTTLEQSIRANVSAHVLCFAIHILLAILALFCSHPWRGALSMLLLGVIIHLYPVLLQRSIMLRLQPLLDKIGFC